MEDCAQRVVRSLDLRKAMGHGYRYRPWFTGGQESSASVHDPSLLCTLLFAQGVDLQTIRDLLGHSSIGVTSAIYVDVLREVQRDAVDRLGHLFGPDDETDI